VRRENKNENTGRLEKSGHGLNMARIVWRGLLLVFVFEPRENALKFHSSVNIPEFGVRIAIVRGSIGYQIVKSPSRSAAENPSIPVQIGEDVAVRKAVKSPDFGFSDYCFGYCHNRMKIKIAPIVESVSKKPKKRFFARLYWSEEDSLFISWMR